MTMNVVLRRDVPDLGAVGDVVKVSNGFARNFLLPRGLAYLVSQDALRRLQGEKKKLAKEAAEARARFEVLAKDLEGKSFSIKRKATEEGHLYGSVDSTDVSAALAEENVEVTPKSVLLEEPIKELGIYEVEIQLHPDVRAKTKIWVVSEEPSETGDEGGQAAPDPEAA